MKNIVLASLVVLCSIAGVLVVKNYFNKGITNQTSQLGADLIVVNDSNDTISTEYKEDGKDIAKVLKPGDQVTGGHGFIRIFTAKKAGSYELTYEFPRPAGAAQKVALSEVVAAAQKKNLGDAVYTEKGMLGDIKVEYEEARVLDSTY